MNKTEYVMRQLAKTNKKNYENYVVTRIWHLLNNTNIKFVTQQYVSRPEGRALTDMFFPALGLHLEIDERHHFNDDGTINDLDRLREVDIINATGHKIERIRIFEKITNRTLKARSLMDINKDIDCIVQSIKNLIEEKNPEIWDIDAEFNPQTYIDRGSISVDDNVAFRTIANACNCFGLNYRSYQKAIAKHAREDKILWFPKLYKNADWDNGISLNENEISMRKIFDHDEFQNENLDKPNSLKATIVFARVRSNLGDVMYRFKGIYKLDVDATKSNNKFIYKRLLDGDGVPIVAKTYKPLLESFPPNNFQKR